MTDNQKNKERLTKALDAMIYLPHLKDRQAQSVLTSFLTDDSAPRATGRPWDKSDLFHRLKTFKASTWFAKPDIISPEECARRGWVNSEVDTITCEACKAIVSCPIPAELLPDEAQTIAEKYLKQITEAHGVACPWRSAVCSQSLLHFPRLARGALAVDFQERFQNFSERLVCLPPLDTSAIQTLLDENQTGAASAQFIIQNGIARLAQDNVPSLQQQQQQLDATMPDHAAFKIDNLVSGVVTYDQKEQFLQRIRALVLCGWSLQGLEAETPLKKTTSKPNHYHNKYLGPESSMLVCTLCGAKAGIWAYFTNCTPKFQQKPATFDGIATVMKPLLSDHEVISGSTPRHATPQQQQRRSSLSSPGHGAALHQQVVINLETTIAGGPIDGASPSPGGPFGLPSSTPNTAASAPGQYSSPGNDNNDSVPVFGFAALKAAENSSSPTHALLQKSAAKRRRDDAMWKAALEGTSSLSNKTQKIRNNDDDGGGGGGEDATMPIGAGKDKETEQGLSMTPAQLQSYRTMSSTPLDPLAIHRHFCPWVHCYNQDHSGMITPATTAKPTQAPKDGATSSLCGWQYCAVQLGPGSLLLDGSIVLTNETHDTLDDDGHNNKDAGTLSSGWNPGQVLRSTLAKVNVTKK